MKALSYIELDLDGCSRSYGLGLCTAIKGTAQEVADGDASSTKKCVNTPATCQDTANYDNEVSTVRYGKTVQASYAPKDIPALFSIISIEYTPSTLSLGKDMGERASIKVTFQDHTHSDVGPGHDKYWNERGSDPKTRGTYWGRFIPRHPYIRGRKLRFIRGKVGQALEDMEKRHFIMDSFSGLTSDGKFSITAKDALKQLDGDRAQAPAVSTGSILASLTTGTTSVTIGPSGIGDEEYPASGIANVGGKELVSFTRVGDVVTMTRAQYQSSAVTHDAGERFQLCLEYISEDPADIIADLMETYAGVDSDQIPLADWKAETEAYYQRVNSALIVEPTAVSTLVNELIEQCGLIVWWSDTEELIRLQVLREIPTTARVFSEGTNIIKGTLKAEQQPRKRISEAWTYYGLNKPLDGATDENNFRSIKVNRSTIDIDYSSPIIKKIISRWIAYGGLSGATRTNELQIGRFQRAPRKITFKSPRRDEELAPVLGEGCLVSGLSMQDDEGLLENVKVQIIMVRPNDDYYDVVAEEVIFDQIGELIVGKGVSLDADDNNVNIRSIYDLLYPAPEVGEIVTVVVNENVIIGSASVGLYSLTLGDWETLEATGDSEIGSPVISSLDFDASNIVEGMFVSGPGISGYAQVITVGEGEEGEEGEVSQVTLDQNLSATAEGASFIFYTVLITLDVRGKIRGAGGNGGYGGVGDNTPGGNGSGGGPAFYCRYPILLKLSGDFAGGGGGGAGGAAYYAWPWGPQYYGQTGGGGAGRYAGSYAGSLDSGGPGRNNGMGWTSGGGGGKGSGGGLSFGGDGRYGGAGGNSIDGWSYIVEVDISGVYYGSKVN